MHRMVYSNDNDYERIAQIEGSRTSNTVKEYNYIAGAKQSGYFKLTQVDLDGSVNDYGVVFVQNCEETEVSEVQINSYLGENNVINI